MDKRKRPVRRLKNVDVSEISVVDSPANLRKFFLFKSTGAHVANMAQTLVESDRAAVNAAFAGMDFEQQQAFLMGMRALTKKVQDAEIEKGVTAEDDGTLAQMVYQVNTLSEDEKADVVDRIKKAIAQIDKLTGDSNLTTLQKARLIDIWRTQLGMIRLGLRDPGLLDEFNKSTAAEREVKLGLRSGCQWEFQLSRAAGSALATAGETERAP